MTTLNLCQVARNMYILKFGRGILNIQVPILDNSNVQYNKTKAAKTHR